MRQLHTAKIIITNDKAPVFNGALLVEDSKIFQFGKKEDFGNLPTHIEIIDHGESLICPGFINLHTHLLYSKVKKINSENGLFPWLAKLVEETSAWTEEDYRKSVQYGINQVLSGGTTFVVENTPNLLSAKELVRSPLKALIGLEVFGSDENKAEEIFNKFLNSLPAIRYPLPAIRYSLSASPHAPYDVSVSLWKKLTAWSEKNNKPLLTHLEESPQEKNWWQTKSGEAVDFWEKINKLEPKLKYWQRFNSGIDFLSKNKVLSKNIIAAHLSQASHEDLKILKRKNIKLIHCPRSNFYLNNGTANLKLWNELKFLWGIGTDSLASNEDLDLLNEVRFMLNKQSIIYDYKISAQDAFSIITSNAAKILNKDYEIGYLKKGCCADFLIYKKPLCTYTNPYEMLIWDIDNKKDLKEVWINGGRAWQAERLLHKI